MERKESAVDLINFILQPAFTVKEGVIDLVNEAARKAMIEQGTAISELLATGQDEYSALTDGCLYLTLNNCKLPCGASVRRMQQFDLFTLEQEADEAELQAMALAAQELRTPLSSVMNVADQLFPVTDEKNDPVMQEQLSRINRGLFQMLRIISNMSDAYRYCQQVESRQSILELTGWLQELFDRMKEVLQMADICFTFENLDRPVHTLADAEKLERAIHNILSNAVKFSKKDGRIVARLTRKDNMLYLSVQDEGEGIRPEVQDSIHARFRRQPGLEDNRFGIGLGMVLIRSAAAAHGGTVLIDHPQEGGTRLTMSLAIRQNTESTVRSSMLRVDYAGERDHPLLELSEVLPVQLYGTDSIN